MIDQAQHFAALGPAGGGGQSADSALAFREGLEVTERERESQITVIPTAGYTSGFDKCSLSRRKAQRRPNSGTSLRIGYGDDGASCIMYRIRKGWCVVRASSSPRSFVMTYEVVPSFVTRR